MIVDNVGEEDTNLEDIIQNRYQQGVGYIMYLVKTHVQKLVTLSESSQKE